MFEGILGDISDYKNNSDLLYIFLGILIIDISVLFLTRYFPDTVGGKYLNVWYNRFDVLAVVSDVFIIGLGFIIARFLYTFFFASSLGWSITHFLLLLIIVQALHDVFFYLGVINQLPRGHNEMIDVFQDYAKDGGYKIIVGDAFLMLGSAVVAMILKEQPDSVVQLIAALTVYTAPYILYTRNKYSDF